MEGVMEKIEKAENPDATQRKKDATNPAIEEAPSRSFLINCRDWAAEHSIKTAAILLVTAVITGFANTADVRHFDFYYAGYSCALDKVGECADATMKYEATEVTSVADDTPPVLQIKSNEESRKESGRGFAVLEVGGLEDIPAGLRLILQCSLKVGNLWGGEWNEGRSYQCPRHENTENCLPNRGISCTSVIRSVVITLDGPTSAEYDILYRCSSQRDKNNAFIWHKHKDGAWFSNGERCDPNAALIGLQVKIQGIQWWKYSIEALRVLIRKEMS